MLNESKSMKELRDIREKEFEATKDMSSEEFLKYIHSEADKAKKEISELRKVRT